MRIVLGCAVIIVLLVANAAAQTEKKKDFDVSKLVGRWGTPAKGKIFAGLPVEEFTKDKKYCLGPPDRNLKLEGSYKIDGDTLTITIGGAAGVPPDVRKRVIKKLTDTSMTYVEGKQTVTLIRVK